MGGAQVFHHSLGTDGLCALRAEPPVLEAAQGHLGAILNWDMGHTGPSQTRARLCPREVGEHVRESGAQTWGRQAAVSDTAVRPALAAVGGGGHGLGFGCSVMEVCHQGCAKTSSQTQLVRVIGWWPPLM